MTRFSTSTKAPSGKKIPPITGCSPGSKPRSFASTCNTSTPPAATGSSATPPPPASRWRTRNIIFPPSKAASYPACADSRTPSAAPSLEVIHVRIQALTADGRDRSKGHKRLGVLAGPGTREADFLEAVGPQGDEIIINKTASGVFSATNLNFVLKNLGITAVYVAGVYTNECVETTIRDACDLGYLVTMVDDCCTTVTPELQRASVTVLRDRYARILSSEDAIAEIQSIEEERLPG